MHADLHALMESVGHTPDVRSCEFVFFLEDGEYFLQKTFLASSPHQKIVSSEPI